MKFAVQVNEGPYQHQASDTAYHFTKTALEKGHEGDDDEERRSKNEIPFW